MMIDDLFDLLLNSQKRISIARLGPGTISVLGAQTVDVMLDGETLKHIIDEHEKLQKEELLLMKPAVERGLIIREKGRPNRLVACFQSDNENRRYALPMKIALGGHELWVSTFHRTRERQTKAYLRRGTILRRHL